MSKPSEATIEYRKIRTEIHDNRANAEWLEESLEAEAEEEQSRVAALWDYTTEPIFSTEDNIDERLEKSHATFRFYDRVLAYIPTNPRHFSGLLQQGLLEFLEDWRDNGDDLSKWLSADYLDRLDYVLELIREAGKERGKKLIAKAQARREAYRDAGMTQDIETGRWE